MPRFLKSTDALIFGGLLVVLAVVRGPALAEQFRTKLGFATPDAAATAPAASVPVPSDDPGDASPDGAVPEAPRTASRTSESAPEVLFFQNVPTHRFNGRPVRFGYHGGFHGAGQRCGH